MGNTSPERSATPTLDRVATPADLRRLPERDLHRLADELRAETIATVSRTGGHLGSSLGVIELTIALHAVFNTPQDKLIWDVGHQCYPHKILTARRDRIGTLRQKDGLSGFTNRAESAFDPFGAGHASTSISAALGFAVGRDFGQPVGDVVAVIGDGSISGGMAFEALNNAGHEGRRLFVVLNDNDMSIAPPVGAMSSYLSDLKKLPPFAAFRDIVEGVGAVLPEQMREGARRARQLVSGKGRGETLFEELGFSYVGPVDGHDLGELLEVLRAARARARGPVLIHCRTVKGKGYAPAENAADKYHGVSSFDLASGQQKKPGAGAPSYTSVFGSALARAARRDPRIVAVTAAMPEGTGVDQMAREFPGRVFDVGIAEQHAVTFAAGMAASGLRPFCAIYSTFLQRAYDQVVHDVALQKLPVRFAIDRAGLVGQDGATHAGAYDLAFLSNLPGFVVMAPSDEAELVHMVATAAAYDQGPIAFRYPRGAGTGVDLPEEGQILEPGRGRILLEGTDVALLSIGTALEPCLAAAAELMGDGICATVADARFAKPLDTQMIARLARSHPLLVTVEQGASGGFGAQVLHYLAASSALDGALKVRTITLPDRFISQGTPEEMYADAGLTEQEIVTQVRRCLVYAGLRATRNVVQLPTA